MQLSKGPGNLSLLKTQNENPAFWCSLHLWQMHFVPSLGIPAGSAAASIPAGRWKASCPILLSSWCITSPNMFQLCCTLGWPGTLRLKIWDVPLGATIVRLSERLTFPTYWNAATITQIAKQIGSQNHLVSSNLLTSMTTSTTGTTISNTKWLRGNARPTLEEVWRSPLCTSPVLCSCSTGTIIVDTGTGSAINTTSRSTWDHLLHHTGVVGNQIARWGGDHQRMLTHIQCANVCTYSIYIYLLICLFICVYRKYVKYMFYRMLHTAYMTYVHIVSICSICSRLDEGCIRLVDLYRLYGWIPANFGTVGTTTPMFHNCQRPSQTHTKPVASAKVTAQMLAGKDHEIPSSAGWNALCRISFDFWPSESD